MSNPVPFMASYLDFDVSPVQPRLLVMTAESGLGFWDLVTGKELHFLPRSAIEPSCAFSSTFGPFSDGRKRRRIPLEGGNPREQAGHSPTGYINPVARS